MKVKYYHECDGVYNYIGPSPLTERRDAVSHPMYSYNRPADMFWQGVYEELRVSGRTHEQCLEILQSKEMRIMLDHTPELRELGHQVVKDCLKGGWFQEWPPEESDAP